MGAGFSSLYHKIHYIKVHYIEVWVYFEKTETYWGHGLTVQLSSTLKLKQYFFFNGKNAEKICAKYKCQNTYLVTSNNHIFDLQKTTKIDKYTAAYVFKSLLGSSRQNNSWKKI